MKAQLAIKLFAFTLVAALVACGGGESLESPIGGRSGNELLTVEGVVQDVQPSSFFGLKSLAVVDDEGRLWQFEGRDIAITGFTASHLREHMILGLRIVVTFEDAGDTLVIKTIEDASSTTPP